MCIRDRKEAADLETTQAQLELQIAEKQRLIAEKQAELDALVNPPEPDPAASPAPIEDSSDKIEQLKQEISTLQGELDVLNKTQADNDPVSYTHLGSIPNRLVRLADSGRADFHADP